MHEIAIAQNIIEIVQQYLPPEEKRRVRVVKLKVGELAGIIPESLAFCFSSLITDTQLQNAALDIEYVPLLAHCTTCQADVKLSNWLFACPQCQNTNITIISGTELHITAIELDEKIESSA